MFLSPWNVVIFMWIFCLIILKLSTWQNPTPEPASQILLCQWRMVSDHPVSSLCPFSNQIIFIEQIVQHLLCSQSSIRSSEEMESFERNIELLSKSNSKKYSWQHTFMCMQGKPIVDWFHLAKHKQDLCKRRRKEKRMKDCRHLENNSFPLIGRQLGKKPGKVLCP